MIAAFRILSIVAIVAMFACSEGNENLSKMGTTPDRLAATSRGIASLNEFVNASMAQGDCEFYMVNAETVGVKLANGLGKELGTRAVPKGLHLKLNSPSVLVKVGTRKIIGGIDSDDNLGGHMRYDPPSP